MGGKAALWQNSTEEHISLAGGRKPLMRQIHHPGPASPERVTAATGLPVPLRFVLEPGDTVDEAIAKGLAASGCSGGFVSFKGGRCTPFRYVMPAASPDADHAAWYSGTYEPAGAVDIERACAIVGIRDDKPFLHCHGVWRTRNGLRMGHMLAPLSTVAKPIEVRGIGVREATFKGIPDQETNFTLFEPVQLGEHHADTSGPRALLAKVRPNQDISAAIEGICSCHRIGRANVYGIGSLNGVRFTDGSQVDSHATEVLIRNGTVESTDNRLEARLAVDVVDIEGRISSGELAHGDNPVCVTFELVIEVLEGESR
jgi:predicted DNA-binding protein with PD1-like motif